MGSSAFTLGIDPSIDYLYFDSYAACLVRLVILSGLLSSLVLQFIVE